MTNGQKWIFAVAFVGKDVILNDYRLDISILFDSFFPKNLAIAKKCITFAPDSARDLDGGCSSAG